LDYSGYNISDNSVFELVSWSTQIHCLFSALSLRYGLREFVVIAPAANNDAVLSESKCNLLLSSVSIALGNTGW